MEHSWIYKQKNYRNSTFNLLKEFVFMQVLPFVIIAIIAGSGVFGGAMILIALFHK